MRTVYIFGAGASRHAGYPLVSDMGRQWLEWMAAYPNGRYKGSAGHLVERFGAAPNVEDMVTELESSIQSLARSDLMDDKLQRALMGSSRGQLLESLREWFCELRRYPAPAYAEFADNVIQSGDVVLTFNYDDSLEKELRRASKWDLSRGYGFPLGKMEQPSPTMVLKLHGSINWLASIFGGVAVGPMAVGPNLSLGQQPVIHKADAEQFGYSDFSGHTYPGGGALVSVILPGRNKEFFYSTSFGNEWEDFFDHLWSQAGSALKQADRLVICGYSMPVADMRAREMILSLSSKRAQVDIICGSQGERIADDFRAAGYSHVSYDANGRFEQWVSSESAKSWGLSTGT